MRKPRYKTLSDYMERTGTNGDRLWKMANARLRGEQQMSRSLFSMILSGGRRCNPERAWALHQITKVPMDELQRWPRYAKTDNAESVV